MNRPQKDYSKPKPPIPRQNIRPAVVVPPKKVPSTHPVRPIVGTTRRNISGKNLEVKEAPKKN